MTSLQPQDNNSRFLTSQAHNRDPTRPDSLKVSGNVNEGVEFEGMSLDQKQQVERLVLHGEYVILNRCNCQVRNDLMFVANYKKQHQGQEYGAKILNTVLEASSIKILSSHENACIHMENTHLKSNQEDILIECKGDVTMGSFESMKNVTIVSTGTVTLNGDGLCKGSCQIYGNDIYVSGSISGVGDVELMASNEITVDGLITSEIGINFQSNNRLVLNGNLGSNAVILNTEGELRHTNYLFTSYQLVIAARTMKKQGHIHCNGNQVVGVTEQIDNETGEWHSKGLSSINAQRMNSHAKIESELTLTLSVVHLTNFDLIEAPTIGFDSLEKLENQPNGKLCCEFIEGWDRRERKLINDGVIEVDSVVLGLDYNQTKTGRLEATRLIIDYQFENKGKCAIEKGLIIGEKSLTKNHGMITASSVNTSKRSKATFENSGTFQVKEESVISGYMIINRGEIYSSDALSVFSSHGNFLNRGRVLCEKDFKLRTKESCLYGEIDIRGDLECIVREKMYVDCRQFNVGGDFSYFGPETTFNNLYQKEGTTICVGGNFNINVAYFFSNGIINAKKNDNSEINKLNIKQWIQSKPSQIQAGKEVCIQVLEKGELDGRLSADKITFLVQGRIEGTNLLEGDEIYASIGQPHEGCTSFHANNAELHLNGTKVNSSTYFRGENAQVVNHGTHEGVSFANVNNHYSHTIHGDQLGSIQGQGNGLFNFQVGGRSVGAVDTSFDRIRAFLAENIEGKQDYSSSDLILSVGGDLKGDLTSSGSSNAVFIQGNQENTLNIYGSKKTNLKINGITSGNTSLKADEMNVSFRGRVDGTQILKSTQLTLTLNEALGGRLKIQSDKSNIQLNETEEASLIDLSGKTCEFHNLGDSSGKFQGNFSDAAHTTFNGQASGQFNMKAPFVDSTFENGIQSDASIEATTLLLRLNDELSGNLYVSSKESYIKTKGTSKDSIMNIDSNFSSLTQDGIVQGSSTLRAIHLMLEIQDTFGGDLNVRTQDAVLKLKDTAQDSYIDTVTKSLEVNQNGTACGKSNFNCSHVNGQFSKVSGNIVVKAIQAILDLNDTLSGNLMIESGKSQIQLRGSSDSSNMSVESNHTSVVERGGHNGKTIIDSNEASYTSMGDSSGDVNMTGNNITTNFFGECSGNISVDADKSQSVFDKGIQGNASFNATQLLLELNQLLDGQVTVHSDQSSIVLNGTSSGSKLSAEGKDVDIRDHGKNKGFVGVEASNNFIYQNDQGNEGSIEAKAGGKIEARIKGESSGSTNFNAKNIEAVFDGIVSGENKMKAENLLVKLNSMLKGNLEIESDNGTVILNGTEKQSRIHATGSSMTMHNKGNHGGSANVSMNNEFFHQIDGNKTGSVNAKAKNRNVFQVFGDSSGNTRIESLKGEAQVFERANSSGQTTITGDKVYYKSEGNNSSDMNLRGNNVTANFFGEYSGNISVNANKSQSVFDKGIQGNASFNATQLLLELNQLLDGQVTVHSDQSSIVLNGTSSGSKLSAEGKDVDIRDHGKNKGFVGVEASNNFIYQNDQGNEGSIEAKAGGKIEARIKGESSGSTNFNAKNIEAVFDGIVSGENKMKAENLLVKLNSMLKGNLEIESDNGTVILNGTEKQSRIHATGSSLSILDKGDHRGSVEAVTDNYFHQINGNQSGSVESRAKHTNELQVSCNSNGKVDLKGRDAYLVVGKNRSGETNMYSENNSIVDAGGNFYFNGNIRGDNTAQIKARNIYDNGKTSSRGLVYKKADSIRDTSNAKTKSKKVYVESNDSGRLNGYYEASNLHIKRKDYTLDNLDNLNSEHIHLEMNSDKIIDKPIFIGTNRLLELSVKSLKNNASIHGDFVARTKNDFKNNGLILGDNIQLEVGGTFFERGTTHGRQNQYTEADYIDFEKVEQNDSRKTRHERRVWEDRNNVSWICRKGDLDFRNSEHDISGNLIMKARGDIWLDNETYQVQKTHDSMTDFSVSAINANKINIDSGKKVHGSGINMHGKNGIDVKGKDGVDMESLASTYISDRWSYREGFLWHRKKEGFRESVNYRGVYMSSSNGSVNVHAPEGSINTRGAKVAANASSTWSAEGNINWDAKKVSTNAQTSTSSCYGLKKSRTSSQTEHGTTFEGYIGNKINAVSSKGKVQAEGAFIHAEQGGKIYGKQGIDFKPLELNHKFKYREGGVKFGHFGSGGISSILPPFMTKMKDLKENQDGTTGAFSDAMGAGVQAFNATKGLAQASISNTPLSWINHQLGLLKFSVGVFKKSHEMNTHEERPGILSTGKNASLELNTGDYGSVNLGTNVNVNDVTFDTPEVNLQGCKTTIESSSRSFSADIGFNPLTNLLYPSSIGTSTQKSHSKQTNQIHTQFKANNMHFKRNKTRMNIQGCSAHVNNTSGGEVDVQEEDMQDEHTETRAGMSWNIGLDMGSVKDIGYGAHFSNTCEKKTQNSTKLDVLNAHSGLRKKEKITKTDTTQGGGFGFHYTHDISDATGESKNTAQDIKVPISVNAQCKGMRMRMEIPELWKTDEIRNGFQTIKNAATFDQNQLPSRQHNYGSNIAALYADTLYKINLCRGKTKEYAQRLVTETVESQNSSSSHPNIQKNVTMSQHQAQCQAAAQVAYEAVENKGNSKDLFKDAIKKTPKLKGYEVAESNRDAFVLVNKETKKAIYAIRGTHWGFDGDCVRDVYCNISYIQANRSLPRSITHEKLFRKFAEQHPDYDFTVTGHSLGGRVAADIALNTGVRAEIFNAAGTKFGDIGNDFTDQEETLQFLEKAYKNGKNITSHILQNDDVGWDFVPKIGHQPTDNIRLYDTPDKTHGIILFGSFAPK